MAASILPENKNAFCRRCDRPASAGALEVRRGEAESIPHDFDAMRSKRDALSPESADNSARPGPPVENRDYAAPPRIISVGIGMIFTGINVAIATRTLAHQHKEEFLRGAEGTG